jgi:hypothetical protein
MSRRTIAACSVPIGDRIARSGVAIVIAQAVDSGVQRLDDRPSHGLAGDLEKQLVEGCGPTQNVAPVLPVESGLQPAKQRWPSRRHVGDEQATYTATRSDRLPAMDDRGFSALASTGDPLGIWCCERGLNSRPLPYQGSALPLSYHSEARREATRAPESARNLP